MRLEQTFALLCVQLMETEGNKSPFIRRWLHVNSAERWLVLPSLWKATVPRPRPGKDAILR